MSKLGRKGRTDILEQVAKAAQHRLEQAMPQEVPPTEFRLDEPEVNQAKALELMADKRLKNLKSLENQGTLYRVGNKIFGYDEKRKRLFFYSQFETKRYSRIGAVTVLQQRVLWGRDYAVFDPILPRWVFFNVLLKQTGIITSDQQQTPPGRYFWTKQMERALRKGLHVYYVDLNRTDDRIKIENSAQILEVIHNKNVYGPEREKKFAARRFVISMKPLPKIKEQTNER